MEFLERVWPPGSIVAGLATLSLAVTLGLGLGAIRVRGFKLGISGVLFSALLFGQFGLTARDETLSFLRDFSLILFVYTIGLQVGPGFVDSLKSEGLRLNLLAIAVLVLGAVMTYLVILMGHFDRASSSGLYAGAFTTTAGLAAGQESLSHTMANNAQAATNLAGLAYAVTYPFGLIGPVLTIAFFRWMLGVKLQDELYAHAAATLARRPDTTFIDIEVVNPEIAGTALRDLALARRHNIVFSRLLHLQKLGVPTADTRIEVGDIIRAVGYKSAVDELVQHLGRISSIDLATVSGDIGRMEVVVTRTAVLRKTLRDLNLTNRLGVTLVRITRNGINLLPTASMALHFGDTVTAVGPPAGIKAFETELGNCVEALNRPQLVPIFLGIVLGILVGSIPLAIPGIPGGMKLGLASGPMIVAIVLSRLGNIGKIVWYMPSSANQLLRDFGLAVFLACVGLQQGDHYVQKLLSGDGLQLVAWGAAVTVLPVLLVGLAARWMLKMNFVTLSGWIAGAMTSSPALIYASEVTQSEAPALAYAAVAPLAFIVPILCCQFLGVVR